MIYLLVIGIAILVLTCIVGNFFMPGMAVSSVFWTAMGFLFLSELLFIGILMLNICRKTSGKPTYLSMVSGASIYVLFSLIFVCITPLITVSFYIYAPHLMALILFAGVNFSLFRLTERNSTHQEELQNIRASAFKRADSLTKAANKLKTQSEVRYLKLSERISLLATQLQYTMFPETSGLYQELDQASGALSALIELGHTDAVSLDAIEAQVTVIEELLQRATLLHRI